MISILPGQGASPVVRVAQLAPVYPGEHVHLPLYVLHSPWPEHETAAHASGALVDQHAGNDFVLGHWVPSCGSSSEASSSGCSVIIL